MLIYLLHTFRSNISSELTLKNGFKNEIEEYIRDICGSNVYAEVEAVVGVFQGCFCQTVISVSVKTIKKLRSDSLLVANPESFILLRESIPTC